MVYDQEYVASIEKQMKLLNESAMVYYNGIPKNLLNKNNSQKDLKDRLSFAK